MTPKQCLRRDIILQALDHKGMYTIDKSMYFDGELTEENIDDVYDRMYKDNGIMQDFTYELRVSYDCETDIECEYSRNYESKSVAKKLSDGRWVGWTYWYGGGKHSDPDGIEWMEDAYFLDCVETKEMVTVRSFAKHMETANEREN